MQIAERSVASFHYTLTNDAGDVLDSSEGREPLAYLHGVGNIVPGLEREMAGHVAGDSFSVDVAPEDGYGSYIDELVQVVPRKSFEGVADLAVGMQFQAQTGQGPIAVVVTEIEGDDVTVDGNHPLAGETLHFAVEIVDVRAASAEELQHGHVHGAGGHHH
ncbi:MAG TPA: peptidylprolyl isomerase [Dokdonella sp.]|jgi:FKBP-type peptidyl-prolyl cis-trans isomerase SlyD|nr:peptidylprolyl isomerase [Dokdonella sp.]